MTDNTTTPTTTTPPKPVTVVTRTPQTKPVDVLLVTNPGLPNWESATPEDQKYISDTRKGASDLSAAYIDFFVNYSKTMHRSVSVPADVTKSMKVGLFRNIKAIFNAPGPDFHDCLTAILKIISIEKTPSGGGTFSEPHCFIGIDTAFGDSLDRQDFKYALSALISLSSTDTRATDLKTVQLDKAFRCLTPTGLNNVSSYFLG